MSTYDSIPRSQVAASLGSGVGVGDVVSWQVSRSLSGGGLPQQARAVSGSSVGSGSVTLVPDALGESPWSVKATVPGEAVSIDAAADIGAPLSPVARMVSRDVSSDGWLSPVRTLSIEDEVPRGQVLIPEDVGRGALDACAAIDAAARAAGFRSTRPPRDGAYASWPLVGALWSEVRGAGTMTPMISDGARYVTLEGRAMLADSMVVGRLVGDSETVRYGYTVEFDLYTGDWQTDTFVLAVRVQHVDLVTVTLDNASPNIVVETTMDSESFAFTSAPALRRVRLYRARDSWRVFIDGYYQGAVMDLVVSGAASVEVAVAGTAYVGCLQVSRPHRPEVDAASNVEGWTGSTTHTHTPIVEAPRGVLVMTTRSGSSSSTHHTVTYGGVEVPLVHMASSGSTAAYAHYLADPPPGPQEVALSGGSGTLNTTVVTVRGDGAVQVRDSAGIASVATNPSMVLGTEDTALPLSVMYRSPVSGAEGPPTATTLATLDTTHRVQVGDVEGSVGGYGWHYIATSAATRLVGVALMYQLGDEQLGGWWEPTARVAHSASPLDSIAEPTAGDAWEVIQQVATATLGACWIDEEGRLVYRNRDQLRGGEPRYTIDALDHLEDVSWSISTDQVADRIEFTYRPPIVSVQADDTLTVWQSTETVRVGARATVRLDRDIDGAASGLAPWFRVEDVGTYPLTRMSRYAAWTAPPGESGSAPPASALDVSSEMLTPTRIRVTIRNTTSAPLWVYELIARARIHVAPGADITIARGLPESKAQRPLRVNAGSWVQSHRAAHSILAWVAGETSRPQPVISRVRIVPDTDLMLGDTVLVRIDSMSGDPADAVTLKALISGVDLSHTSGGLSQSVSLTVLAMNVGDFNERFSGYTVADFNAEFAGMTVGDLNRLITIGGLL